MRFHRYAWEVRSSVQVDFSCLGRPVRPHLEVGIKNSFGVTVFHASNRVITQYQFPESMDKGSITCNLPDLPLGRRPLLN